MRLVQGCVNKRAHSAHCGSAGWQSASGWSRFTASRRSHNAMVGYN